MTNSVDKCDLFLFLDVIEFFTEPFHGMQCRFAIIDHFEPVYGLTFFDERYDLLKQAGLMLCNRLFPDKCILICAGFDFCPRSWRIDVTLVRIFFGQEDR